jgi:hypothetical protein
MRQVVAYQPVRALLLAVGVEQQLIDLISPHFAIETLRLTLHGLAELNQQLTWQADAVELFENEAHTALAGLTVDAHRFLVRRTHIRRIDRQIGYLPAIAVNAGPCPS